MLLLLNEIELLFSQAAIWVSDNSTIVEACAAAVSTVAAIIALRQSSNATKISNKQSIFEKRLAAYSIVSSLCETYRGYKENRNNLPDEITESQLFDHLTRSPVFYDIRALRPNADDSVVYARRKIRQKLVEDLRVISDALENQSVKMQDQQEIKTIEQKYEEAKTLAEIFNELDTCEDINLSLQTLRSAEELMMCKREIDMLWHRRIVIELNLLYNARVFLNKLNVVWKKLRKQKIEQGENLSMVKMSIKYGHKSHVKTACEFVECYARVLSNLSFLADASRRSEQALQADRLQYEIHTRRTQLNKDKKQLEDCYTTLCQKKHRWFRRSYLNQLKDDIRL